MFPEYAIHAPQLPGTTALQCIRIAATPTRSRRVPSWGNYEVARTIRCLGRLAEHRAVALERPPARPIVDQPNQLESTASDFGDKVLHGDSEITPAQKHGRREIDDGE